MSEQHFLRSFPAKPIHALRASNHQVWTADRCYVDVGGASHGVNLIGHNHPDVVAAIREQAGNLVHVAQGIQNPLRAAALDRFHAMLPRELGRTFLANSGAEANELALKLAVAKTGRGRFTAMEQSFHGRTLGALSLTHRAAFRQPFQPALLDVDFAPWTPEGLAQSVSHGTAAIVMEPIQGEGGIRAASPELLRAARELADDHGALLIFDEVQCGLGRTGTMLASSPSGVVPDVVTFGKGLAGGLPVGACAMTQDVAASLPPGGHGSTYGGSPVVAAAMDASLRVIEAVMPEVPAKAEAMLGGLEHPAIKDVTGRGLMVGVSLRVRPQPVLAALQEAGILALSAGRQIRFLPPLTMPTDDLVTTAKTFVECL